MKRSSDVPNVSAGDVNGAGSDPAGPQVSIDDYRDLVHASSARIACFEFLKPLRRPEKFSKHDNIEGSLIWNIDSRCIEANGAFISAYGRGFAAKTLGRSLSDLLPAEHGFDQVFRTWLSLDCSDSSFEVSSIGRSGNPEILQLVVYAKGNTPDSFSRIWIIMRDMTAHALRLRDTIEAERHYRSLLERPGLILVRVHPSGRYEYISPSVKTILGFTKEDFNRDAELFLSILHPEDRHRFEVIREARRHRQPTPIETEYRLKLPNGSFHTFFIRQTAKFSPDGEIEFFDLVAVDVEEQRELQRQAHHAQRLDMVGSLAAGIAHDVNNHLTAILGQLSEGLRSTSPGDNVHERLEAAQRSALQCADLSRQLLQLGRKEAEKVENIEPEQSLKESLDLVRHVIPINVQILVRSMQNLPLLKANPTQFHQLVMNLIFNARDAMPAGGILSLTLNSTFLEGTESGLIPRSFRPGKYVSICVSDTGCGIAPDTLEKIFDPFFTTKAGGSGLGLSTVYSIIRTHHGALAVKSLPERGTTFTAYLPAAESVPIKVEVANREDLVSLAKSVTRETVLIAEDDDLVRSMLASVLTARGYHVVSAGNGEEAVALYQNLGGSVRAVVLDENMPKLLGTDAARRILTRNPQARVLITSGYGKYVSENFEPPGAVEFLSKPYSLADLFQAIDRMTH